MAKRDFLVFDQFLTKSFSEGVYERELRLSPEELTFAKGKFPTATFRKTANRKYKDQREWYHVSLIQPSIGTKDIETRRIKEENIRLKKEIERIKKRHKIEQ
ncbi:hypothetical protein RZN22_11905 [Bacillaceae bacterium S4-13-58]